MRPTLILEGVYQSRNAQAQTGQLKDAEISFRKAGELSPDDPLPIYSLGVLSEQQRKFSEAIEFYKRSVEIDPKFENGYFNLAAMLANLGRFAEAKSMLLKLLELNPQADDARAMLRQIEREIPKQNWDPGYLRSPVSGFVDQKFLLNYQESRALR